MRKLVISLISLVVVAAMGAPKHADAAMILEVPLTGSEEVPPVIDTASGIATLIVNEVSLTYSIQLFGLDLGGQTADPNDDVTGLHIHNAPFGANGPIVFGIINPDQDTSPISRTIVASEGKVTGAWSDLDPANESFSSQFPDLLAGNLYINIHTVANPGGQIRGQIPAVPEPATLLLIGSGLVGMGAVVRRRHRRK